MDVSSLQAAPGRRAGTHILLLRNGTCLDSDIGDFFCCHEDASSILRERLEIEVSGYLKLTSSTSYFTFRLRFLGLRNCNGIASHVLNDYSNLLCHFDNSMRFYFGFYRHVKDEIGPSCNFIEYTTRSD